MSDKPTADALVRHQKQRKETTLERATSAMRTIEAEIKEHGTYPSNNGVINMTEVCKRAGIGSTTLRNKHHHPTRDIVKRWLVSIEQRAPTSMENMHGVHREKIKFYEEALRKVNAEAVEWRVELAALAEENRELREQIAILPGGKATVVDITRRKSRND